MTVDTGLQPLAVGINIVSPSLALIFVVLRLYSRHVITRNLGWEDSLIVISMVLSITMAVSVHLAIMASYTGYHFKDILTLEVHPVLVKKYNYIAQMLYNPILALVKNAVLILFLRLGRTFDALRVWIYSLLVLNNLMMVAIFIVVIFQCTPITKTFHSELPGTCINTPHFFITTAGLTILTDVLVLIIPTWLLWDLQMKPRKKIATVFLLSLGCLVTSISVFRLWFLVTIYYGSPDPDPTYSVAGTASGIEVNVAIITACGPSMKPLIVRYLPSVFERDTTDEHASDWPSALAFGNRIQTYSASATAFKSKVAAAKLGSSFGSDVELQRSARRSSRGGKYGRSLRSWYEAESEDEDEDDRNYFDDWFYPRKIMSRMPSVRIMGRRPSASEEIESGLQEGREQQRPVITRHVTVHITYSPSDSNQGNQF